MFATRADLAVDLIYLVTLLAPIATLISFRRARGRRYASHRTMQCVILCVCFAAVLAFEARIRIGGGSGSLLAQAPPEYAGAGRVALGVHVSVAILTYLAWAALAVLSLRRFRARLPGTFSRPHRRAGWLVFSGLCVTAASASVMYVIAFVA